MSKRKANTGGALATKRRPNFTGAEVEVLLQNVDVSILFHHGYIHAIEFSAYLFIQCHLQCSCSARRIMTINVKRNCSLYKYSPIYYYYNYLNPRMSVELMCTQSPMISHKFSP